LFETANVLDYTVHSIFVVKYWVIAKKLQYPDRSFETKSKLVYYGQLVLIVLSVIPQAYYLLHLSRFPYTWEHLAETTWCSVPAFTITILLVDAFVSMSKDNKLRLSKFQVVVQTSVNLGFALLLCSYGFFDVDSQPWKIV
jgi:small-conductance mechanosensitive channel